VAFDRVLIDHVRMIDKTVTCRATLGAAGLSPAMAMVFHRSPFVGIKLQDNLPQAYSKREPPQ
jgi:hypothetical protein